jgi:hypothetical protein
MTITEKNKTQTNGDRMAVVVVFNYETNKDDVENGYKLKTSAHTHTQRKTSNGIGSL